MRSVTTAILMAMAFGAGVGIGGAVRPVEAAGEKSQHFDRLTVKSLSVVNDKGERVIYMATSKDSHGLWVAQSNDPNNVAGIVGGDARFDSPYFMLYNGKGNAAQLALSVKDDAPQIQYAGKDPNSIKIFNPLDK